VPEIPEWLFWGVMVLIVVLSMLYKPKDRAGGSGVTAAAAAPLDDGSTTT
jgi:hypothetical protein